jgi:hypothetical protein
VTTTLYGVTVTEVVPNPVVTEVTTTTVTQIGTPWVGLKALALEAHPRLTR